MKPCGCLDHFVRRLYTFSLVLLPGHGFPLHVPCSPVRLSNALVGSLCLEQTVQRLAVPRGCSGSDRGQPCFPLTHISHSRLRFVRYFCVCALILFGLFKPLALQDPLSSSWWRTWGLVFSSPLTSFSTFLRSSPVFQRLLSSWCDDDISLNSQARFPYTFLSVVRQ